MSASPDDKQKRYGSNWKKKLPVRELLPLGTPLAVMVDPSNGCNFRCVFCPTGNPELLKEAQRPRGAMKLELFRKIVEDMRAFPQPAKVLQLYKDGEPLVNVHFTEFVRMAKEAGVAERVETTTNGSLLTREKADALVDAGLDGIRVSVYAVSDEGYRDTCRTTSRFDNIRANVAYLHEVKTQRRPGLHIHCKILDVGLSAEDKQRFLDVFTPISDSVHIDAIMGWSNTGEHDMTLGLQPTTGMAVDGAPLLADRRVCSEPFVKLVVNFDGSVSACCVDWSMDTHIGDVTQQSLAEIWNGDALRAFRLTHLSGRREDIRACTGCQYVLGLPDLNHLDDDADRLLDVYRKSPS
ncbi:MAG: radical SAM protein [Rhodospirillaceae bacterium]|nr:radical SAM protein [Rhodospirillales bacterium]